ncbi:MAG: diaminopimelate epimerase [Flavobacteriales bacterium]|nr:diaminopimelate epimerase [Flavobacteriales bacterium]
MHFHKYQGTGNDFILVDGRDGKFTPSRQEIVKLCDRRFGIGSDGIIIIEETGDADFYMNFFNPDGSQSFCGNGSRCAILFAKKLGIIESHTTFKAIDGTHQGVIENNVVRIHMRNVLGVEQQAAHYIIHTGSPHYIIYVDDVDTVDLMTEARAIRFNPRFKEEGINVNFVEASPLSLGEGQGEVVKGLRLRTYERGVEGETLSCGTGVTAAALSYAHQHPELKSVIVQTRGGQLSVEMKNLGDDGFEDIWLIGPAQFVYEGDMG